METCNGAIISIDDSDGIATDSNIGEDIWQLICTTNIVTVYWCSAIGSNSNRGIIARYTSWYGTDHICDGKRRGLANN